MNNLLYLTHKGIEVFKTNQEWIYKTKNNSFNVRQLSTWKITYYSEQGIYDPIPCIRKAIEIGEVN